MKISTILATKGVNVVSVRPEQTLKEAVALLAQHNVGALVVVNQAGNVVGIFSERDLIRQVARRDDALAMPVSEAMTRRVTVGSPDDDLKSVLLTMTERRFRHLPVMDRGKLIGIVSIGDLVKAQLEEYRGEIDTLHTQITEG